MTHGDIKKTVAKKARTNQQNRTQTNWERCNQKVPNETLPILFEQTKAPGLKYAKMGRTSSDNEGEKHKQNERQNKQTIMAENKPTD